MVDDPVLTEAQTRALLDVMVRTSPQKRDTLGHLYLGRAGDDLPRYLAEYFVHEKKAAVREDLLRFAGPSARTDDRVVDLALLALDDRSAKVRRQALWILTRSGQVTVLPILRAWNARGAEEVQFRDSAIRAIERQNIQEWVRGTRYSAVVEWQFSRHAVGSADFDASVDRYVARFAADLVPDLERALGSIHLRS